MVQSVCVCVYACVLVCVCLSLSRSLSLSLSLSLCLFVCLSIWLFCIHALSRKSHSVTATSGNPQLAPASQIRACTGKQTWKYTNRHERQDIYACTHICTNAYIHIHIHAIMHAHTHKNKHAYMHAHSQHTPMQIANVHTHTHAHTQIGVTPINSWYEYICKITRTHTPTIHTYNIHGGENP